jgi:hypothetical protein
VWLCDVRVIIHVYYCVRRLCECVCLLCMFCVCFVDVTTQTAVDIVGCPFFPDCRRRRERLRYSDHHFVHLFISLWTFFLFFYVSIKFNFYSTKILFFSGIVLKSVDELFAEEARKHPPPPPDPSATGDRYEKETEGTCVCGGGGGRG